MKKLVLFSTFSLALISTAFPQTKVNFTLLKKCLENKQDNTQLIDVFIQGDVNTIRQIVNSEGGIFKYSAGDIAVVKLPLSKISKIITDKAIQRIEAYPQHIQLMNDTMLLNNDIIPVHNGQAPLPQGYDGAGVVIGFIDTGIDFTHPDFKDSLGKSRIIHLWDQTKPIAPNTPLPYHYGQEWNNLQIDSGKANAHNDLTYSGHGTHVAGIGVGNGLATGHYKGAAPKADIIMVALNFQSQSSTLITDAVNYIYSKAQELGKPCVINASLGDSYGSHDGKDLQAQLISNLINQQPGRAFVAAAGNSGSNPYHLGYTVTSDTNFTMFKYSASNGAVYIQVWADVNDFNNVHFAIGADKMSPVHSFRGRTAFSTISSHLGILKADTLFKNGHRIGIVQSYGDLHAGTYSMEFYIQPDSTNYNWRMITTGSGKFDVWSNYIVRTNLPSPATMSDSIYYKLPDVNKTIVSSFQCLDNVVTVANYTNRKSYIDCNNTMYVDSAKVPGKRDLSSSIGPTRDGRIKPDIASPGDMTMAAVVISLAPGIAANYPDALAFGGKHVRDGGTSHSTPGVAGIAALYLQKNPTATAMEVKQAITGCARQDQFTGNNLPDNYWGYGKADAFMALTNCSTSVEDHSEKIAPTLSIFPNPSLNELTIHIEGYTPQQSDKAEVRIYNSLGELVKNVKVNGTIILIQGSLQPGIYLCALALNGATISSEKLIIL